MNNQELRERLARINLISEQLLSSKCGYRREDVASSEFNNPNYPGKTVYHMTDGKTVIR